MRNLLRKWFLLIGRKDLATTQFPLVLINFFFQRILGKNSRISFPVHFTSHIENVDEKKLPDSFKKSCAVSAGANIVVYGGTNLQVGSGTIFANNFCLRTANHDLLDRNVFITGDVTIGENCWFGHGSVVLPGVSLGDNVTIGANSVVTKSFPSNVVLGGVPAKLLKAIPPLSDDNRIVE